MVDVHGEGTTVGYNNTVPWVRENMHIEDKTKKQLIKRFNLMARAKKRGEPVSETKMAHLKGALRDRGVKVF